MVEFSKASEAIAYLNNIVKRMRGVKIKKIFSECPSFSTINGFRRYEDDTPLYILFENEQCLIINYRFIDEFCVDFRPLTEEEKGIWERQLIKDIFNCTTEIHAWAKNEVGELIVGEVDHTESISLEYDSLQSVDLRLVATEYSKWTSHGLDYVIPSAETFDEIKFTMNNGNTFMLCPEDADMDGYIMAWSVDAKESASVN